MTMLPPIEQPKRLLMHFLPTTKKELERLGWDTLDVIIFSADAYIDHPSFAMAVIGRMLEVLARMKIWPIVQFGKINLNINGL